APPSGRSRLPPPLPPSPRWYWPPRPRPSLASPLRARLPRMQLVRLDDALNEPVSHDVLVAEPDECDPVDRAEDVLHVDEAGGLLAGEVDLRHVARPDPLGAEAE